MKKDFIVNVADLTKPTMSDGLGKILVVDNELDIPYSLTSGLKELAAKHEELTPDTKLYKMIDKIMGGKDKPREIAVYGDALLTDGTELVEALDELIEEQNSGWFFLASTMNDAETIRAVSEWADINDKFYSVTSQELEVVKTVKSKNTTIAYHDDPQDLLAEGLLTNLVVNQPGSITAKFEQVRGSTASNIKKTELKQLHMDFGLTSVRNKGVTYVSDGKTTDGSYIDIVLGSYFIKFTLEDALFNMAINNGKVPYGDRGIGMMVAEVETVMKTATRQGVILEEDGRGVYEITALRRSEVSKNDVAKREYNGISVKAVVAGAVHSSEINIDLVLGEDE